MRPAEVVRRATRYLEHHGVESPGPTAEVLLTKVLGIDRARLYTREEGLSSAEARAFGRALCVRCTGTPVQHLTGEQAFRRLSLEVRPGVFIPRPETEVLVGFALDSMKDVNGPMVVDVGTGTGAIALSIKDERPDATVFAIDRSVEAVALARSNAERLGLDVDVREGDMLSPLPADLRGTIDVVVSNPPYVSEGEFEELPDDVRADPASALFGALDVYKRLVADSLTWLKPDGVLAVEIDSRRGEDVQGVFVQCRLTNVQTFKDMNGLDRVVSGRRP